MEERSLLKYTVFFTFIALLAARFGSKDLEQPALVRLCSKWEGLSESFTEADLAYVSVLPSHAKVELEILVRSARMVEF